MPAEPVDPAALLYALATAYAEGDAELVAEIRRTAKEGGAAVQAAPPADGPARSGPDGE